MAPLVIMLLVTSLGVPTATLPSSEGNLGPVDGFRASSPPAKKSNDDNFNMSDGNNVNLAVGDDMMIILI